MNKKKRDQLNLKGPDVFQVKASESIEFVKKNSKVVYLAITVAVVAVLASFGIQQYQSSGAEKRQSGLSAIDLAYNDELKAHEEKKTDLEKQIDDLKLLQKEKKSEANTAKLKTLEEQLAKLGEASHDKSLALYKEFYDNHLSHPEGWVAGIRYAYSLAEDNKFDEAEAIVRNIFERSKGYSLVSHQSGLMLISILEDQGKFADSVTIADALVQSSGEELKPHYLLAKARGLFLQKKNAEAKAVAHEIIEKYENSQESEKARGLLALIN